MRLSRHRDTQARPKSRVLKPAGPLLTLFLIALPALADSTFGQLDPQHDYTEALDFKVGQSLFERLWVSAPSSTQAADGIGPLFNARACSSCHVNHGRGKIPTSANQAGHALVLHINRNGQPHPVYGRQLQSRAVTGLSPEYRLRTNYQTHQLESEEQHGYRLRKPDYTPVDLGYGTLEHDTVVSPRIAPQLVGMGWLDRIPAATIRKQADPDDKDRDGISGQVAEVTNLSSGVTSIGRFGYKAGMPNLSQQIQAAFNRDMGLSTPLYPLHWGDCTEQQTDCLAAPHGNSPQYDGLEVHSEIIEQMTRYLTNLKVPAQQSRSPSARRGQKLFGDIGCGKCHTPAYTVGETRIHPYTDLLLHDMGEALSDGDPSNGREWRTAPLWGIGHTARVTGQSHFLHDGRARSLLEAILWHGGEARQQRDRVAALEARDRQALIDFLGTL